MRSITAASPPRRARGNGHRSCAYAAAVVDCPAGYGSPCMSSVYDFSARDIDGQERPLSEWQGRWLLIVNVASRCGFTPQYTGLQALWRTWRDRGLTVLGFPCDQFGHQEPGNEVEISQFC